MKRGFIRFALVACTLLNVAYAGTDSTTSPDIFDLPITTLSGDTFTLGDYRNRQAIYLKFWATWCQPCRKEMPHLQHAFEKYGDKIKIVAVNIGINEDMAAIKATMQEFGLTLPITVDSSGALSKAFNMIGTPYHVLIDKNGNVVHHGHKASEELDNKLAQLSDYRIKMLPGTPLQHTTTRAPDLGQNTDKLSALFFLSTWCDWYLKDSRPAMSANCTNAQQLVNTLYTDNPEIDWRGIVSRLWTGKKELNAYREKHHIQHPLVIDTSGDVFLKYDVKHLPTLILTRNGKEVFRETDFRHTAALTDRIKTFYSRKTSKATHNTPSPINTAKH